MNKSYILNYIIKIIIIIFWIYLYYTGALTLNRIITFILVLIFILVYSRGVSLIYDISLNEKVKKYIKDHKGWFLKILYILLDIHRWINPVIVFLAYTDKWLYRINRYITGTKFVHYNFVIYVLMKYYVMFGLMKLIIHKYYNLWYKLDSKTIIEILFKRMYGLILSILIFTDLLNNIIGFLSQYSVWIYVVIYYIISTFCVMWELLYFYYNLDLEKWILSLLNLKWAKNIFNYLNIFKLYEFFLAFVWFIIGILSENLERFTKMHVIIFLRSQYTWLGRIITDLLDILVPKESNFTEQLLYVHKFSATSFFCGPNIAYYKPVSNFISLKYFEYFGYFSGLICLRNFEPIFELFWKSYIYSLSYNRFFKLKCEIKYKPSILLYIILKDLAVLYDVHNQPINRLMDWMYFDMKYKETPNIFNDNEKIIINQNLSFLKRVDELRAQLMFFVIWDIENFYNENKDYCWSYWILQLHSVLDVLIFMINQNEIDAFELNLLINKKYNNKEILKIYDPEENMEFLNRLFNVLGIVNSLYFLDKEKFFEKMDEAPYHVSKKFVNYNEKYVELARIMYSHEFNRWEENQCECSYLSNYEVEIAYKTEDYFQFLHSEWETSIKTEKLEERNWRLLKSLEDLMS